MPETQNSAAETMTRDGGDAGGIGDRATAAPAVTVRLAREDIAELAAAIATAMRESAPEPTVHIAPRAMTLLAAAFTKALHEKMRSPNFQFDVLHRLPYSQDSADYVSANMPDALKIPGKEHHFKHALTKIGEGMLLEFGVFRGQSINQIARVVPDRTVHGFDSFEGLPEDWSGYNVKAEFFDQQGDLPKVVENVSLYKGWFDDSLPAFLEQNPGPVAFIHVDCDLYSSTKTVLTELAPRVQAGTVIVFDEYHNFPHWREHEHKALVEFCAEFGVKYEYIAYNNLQAAIKVIEIAGRPATP